MDQKLPPHKVHTHTHSVQFYGSDDTLVSTVAAFLSEGLVKGQPAVIVATELHRQAILEQLCARLIDVSLAHHIGDLVVLDAEETLATFMIGDLPDQDRFNKQVGAVIEQA